MTLVYVGMLPCLHYHCVVRSKTCDLEPVDIIKIMNNTL